MILFTIILILLMLVALLLIGIIMMQSSEGGLSSAIGGTSQITTTFGSQTPSILIKTTTILAIIFGALTIGLNTYSLVRTDTKTKSMLLQNAEAHKNIQPLNLYKQPAKANATSAKKANSSATENNPFPEAKENKK